MTGARNRSRQRKRVAAPASVGIDDVTGCAIRFLIASPAKFRALTGEARVESSACANPFARQCCALQYTRRVALIEILASV
jgi:hypothetical protein